MTLHEGPPQALITNCFRLPQARPCQEVNYFLFILVDYCKPF